MESEDSAEEPPQEPELESSNAKPQAWPWRTPLPLPKIQEFYHLPMSEAAVCLGVSLSRLKRECRKYRVLRWPSRKVRGQCSFEAVIL